MFYKAETCDFSASSETENKILPKCQLLWIRRDCIFTNNKNLMDFFGGAQQLYKLAQHSVKQNDNLVPSEA